MATLNKRTDRKKTTFYIQLTQTEDKRRPKISIGSCSLKDARTARTMLEELISKKTAPGKRSPAVEKWLDGITDGLRDRLEGLGLVEPQDGSRWTVGAFVDAYIKKRKDVKESTRRRMGDVQKRLNVFFPNTPIESVTVADAKDYKIFLKTVVNLSENTARRNIGMARQFFNAAMESRIITENPFKGLPVTVKANKARFFYITPEMAQKVLDACPDAEWRLIFGLVRFGGLRCPTEVLRLKWEDVDFEKEQFTVHASKKEHCEDGGIRDVPMFPELKMLFQDAFDNAPEGSVYCINRYRSNDVNLRTQLTKIIKRAGLTPWPKLFQNCRSTRETELFKITNGEIDVVCAWIGNSPAIALRHYYQYTGESKAEATKKAVLEDAKRMIQSGVQIGVQHPTKSGCNQVHEEKTGIDVNP